MSRQSTTTHTRPSKRSYPVTVSHHAAKPKRALQANSEPPVNSVQLDSFQPAPAPIAPESYREAYQQYLESNQ